MESSNAEDEEVYRQVSCKPETLKFVEKIEWMSDIDGMDDKSAWKYLFSR